MEDRKIKNMRFFVLKDYIYVCVNICIIDLLNINFFKFYEKLFVIKIIFLVVVWFLKNLVKNYFIWGCWLFYFINFLLVVLLKKIGEKLL